MPAEGARSLAFLSRGVAAAGARRAVSLAAAAAVSRAAPRPARPRLSLRRPSPRTHRRLRPPAVPWLDGPPTRPGGERSAGPPSAEARERGRPRAERRRRRSTDVPPCGDGRPDGARRRPAAVPARALPVACPSPFPAACGPKGRPCGRPRGRFPRPVSAWRRGERALLPGSAPYASRRARARGKGSRRCHEAAAVPGVRPRWRWACRPAGLGCSRCRLGTRRRLPPAPAAEPRPPDARLLGGSGPEARGAPVGRLSSRAVSSAARSLGEGRARRGAAACREPAEEGAKASQRVRGPTAVPPAARVCVHRPVKSRPGGPPCRRGPSRAAWSSARRAGPSPGAWAASEGRHTRWRLPLRGEAVGGAGPPASSPALGVCGLLVFFFPLPSVCACSYGRGRARARASLANEKRGPLHVSGPGPSARAGSVPKARQLLAVDHSARASMKNAASCEN